MAETLFRSGALIVLSAAIFAACAPLPPAPDEPPVEVVPPAPPPEPEPDRPFEPPAPIPEPEPREPELGSASASLLDESRRHQATGNYMLAAIAIERALRLEPRQPVLWLELGEIHMAEGDYAQAEAMASRALGFSGAYPSVRQRAEQLLATARRNLGR